MAESVSDRTLQATQHTATLAPEIAVVRIRDLRFAAQIGVHAHEVGRPQTLVADVKLTVRFPAGDQMKQTIDYRRVVEAAEALSQAHIALIETFAARLALACLEHPSVLVADVAIEKPGALISGVAGAQVRIEKPPCDAATSCTL